jgi:hypothetical protein
LEALDMLMLGSKVEPSLITGENDLPTLMFD